jgi:hypothetical protein
MAGIRIVFIEEDAAVQPVFTLDRGNLALAQWSGHSGTNLVPRLDVPANPPI